MGDVGIIFNLIFKNFFLVVLYLILPMENQKGYNLGVRSFCSKVGCDFEYFECPVVCEHLKKKILQFLFEKLSPIIQSNGFKSQYTLMELKINRK